MNSTQRIYQTLLKAFGGIENLKAGMEMNERIHAQMKLNRMENRIGHTYHTYFIEDKKAGLVKIGKSKDVHARLKGLSTGNPNLHLIGHLPFDIETTLHKKYAHLNVGGEWFRLNEEITNALLDSPEVIFNK